MKVTSAAVTAIAIFGKYVVSANTADTDDRDATMRNQYSKGKG